MAGDDPFLAGLASGRLVLQRCEACHAVQPCRRFRCHACGHRALAWSDTPSRGTIYAVTTVFRAPDDMFRALAPYALCLVDLDAGGRIMGHCAPDTRIDTPVIGRTREIAGKPMLYFDENRGSIRDDDR